MIAPHIFAEQERRKCAGKRRWSRWEAAQHEIESPRMRGWLYGPIFVYHCPWCYGWHLTSTSREGQTA